MPAKNAIKIYADEQYYHIYSRGVAKQDIFRGKNDYIVFLSLLKRYLSSEPASAPFRKTYPHYGKRLELLSFCLMSNHFHLLIYQHDKTAMTDFMRALMTGYSMYFNKKYHRVGPLFQGRFKASRIDSEAYIFHISRYIHLNPKKWQTYQFSSLPYFQGERKATWIRPKRVLDIFKNKEEYLDFLHDYESYKDSLDEIKWELAHE
jgi:putative transposase